MIPIRDGLMARLHASVAAYDALPDLEKRRMNWDQRVSFVYGNVSLSNDRITREMVIQEVTKIYGPRP